MRAQIFLVRYVPGIQKALADDAPPVRTLTAAPPTTRRHGCESFSEHYVVGRSRRVSSPPFMSYSVIQIETAYTTER